MAYQRARKVQGKMEQMVLFSQVIKKANTAVEMIQLFEPTALQYHPDGYYLAFSGGKDSVAIYGLAQMAGVKFKAHYHLTTVDPPELVYFIRNQYPDVIIDPPEITMWNLIEKKQFPPMRTGRYCCEVLKRTRRHGIFHNYGSSVGRKLETSQETRRGNCKTQKKQTVRDLPEL